MSESETRDKLRGWILQRSKKKITASDLDDETPIVDSGLLSSLDIAEFVLFIESLRGDEVDVDDLEPEVFANINSVYEAFFAA
jgi:acyl carrier protein